MFIYGFGYFHFKQRLQKRLIAELVIRSSNNQTDDMQCKVISSNPAAVDANFPLQTNQKTQDEKLLG